MAEANPTCNKLCLICNSHPNETKLPCSHEFCIECITNMESNNDVKCPLCREPWKEADTSLIKEEISSLKFNKKPHGNVTCSTHHKTLTFWCKDCSSLACNKCIASTHKSHDLDAIEDVLPLIKSYIESKIDDRNESVEDDKEVVRKRVRRNEEIIARIKTFEKELVKERKRLRDEIREFDEVITEIDGSGPKLMKMKSNLKNQNVDEYINIITECQEILNKTEIKIAEFNINTLLSDSICSFVEELSEIDSIDKTSLINPVKKKFVNQSVQQLGNTLKNGGKWIIADSMTAEAAVNASKFKHPSHLEIIQNDKNQADNMLSDALYRVLNNVKEKINVSIKCLDSFDSSGSYNIRDKELFLICKHKNCALKSFFGCIDAQIISLFPQTVKPLGLSLKSQNDFNLFCKNASIWQQFEEIHLCLPKNLHQMRVQSHDAYGMRVQQQINSFKCSNLQFIHFYDMDDTDLKNVLPTCGKFTSENNHYYQLCFPRCRLSYSAMMTLPERLKGTYVKNLHFEMVTQFSQREKQNIEEEVKKTLGWCGGVNWNMDSVFGME